MSEFNLLVDLFALGGLECFQLWYGLVPCDFVVETIHIGFESVDSLRAVNAIDDVSLLMGDYKLFLIDY